MVAAAQAEAEVEDADTKAKELLKMERMGLTPDWIIQVLFKLLPATLSISVLLPCSSVSHPASARGLLKHLQHVSSERCTAGYDA